MFPVYTLPPDSKETGVGSRDQEAFSLAAEFTGVVLMPCHAMHRSMSLQLLLVMCIFPRSLGVIYYNRLVLSRDHKNYRIDWCLLNSQPTFLILTSINSMKWPFYQKDANQIHLNHKNLWNLAFWICHYIENLPKIWAQFLGANTN